MKRFTFLFCILFLASLAMAQVPTLHDPNAQATVTREDVDAWKQASDQEGSRSLVVLDFEGLLNNELVLNFYNGANGSLGSSGPNYGVSFTPTGLSLIDQDNGGTGNFANEPSPNTILFWLTGGSTTMNIANGFETGVSLKYTAATSTGSVSLYSDLNGTGSLLATATLPQNHTINCSGDPTGDYCHWDLVSLTFAGTAHSIVFTGTNNQIGFDDITFDNLLPVVPVANWALFLGIGLILAYTVVRMTRLI
ncbi:MAG TPA: hypothetical protein PK711_03435 [Bacteroidales bacterium]|nr:hypothetical protein [Bacteroidales bacterium]